MDSTQSKIPLVVLEADSKDVGKGIARVDPYVMEKLKLENGDVIYIEGKRKTVARVSQGSTQDWGLHVIRLDHNIRK
ncbi:MAG: AAA family ATPase, partial [Desulfurococcaceae archaeon]